MKRYVFYHAQTGLLHREVKMLDDSSSGNNRIRIDQNTPEGHIALEHPTAHPSCHRVDPVTKEVLDWQPPQPSPDHQWDAATKRWTVQARNRALAEIAAIETKSARAVRELLLELAALVGHASPAVERLKAVEGEIAERRGAL